MQHDSSQLREPSRPLATLRRFVGQRRDTAAVEHCELCGSVLAPVHQHLIEVANRRLACTCDACAILFDAPVGGRFRRVPRSGRLLSDFVLSDGQWDDLLIPIDVAFFFNSSPVGRVMAMYPSPAGAIESLLPLESWHVLVEQNEILRGMQPDVEALLANRLGPARGCGEAEYYLAPIDSCFQLVGLIRTHWRGLSGGTEVWKHMATFFAGLKSTSAVTSAASSPSRGAGDA
jgi:hypothetical protein